MPLTPTSSSNRDLLLLPLQYIPKTTMNFAGFKSPQDRADVIAYLKVATQ